MKETPYLDFYYKCMETGTLPCGGLCFSLDSGLLGFFKPVDNNNPDLVDRKQKASYWGYDGKVRDFTNNYGGISMDTARHEFTPLRQTIVLFLAAMNNEL